MYGCSDPSCVDMDRLQYEQKRALSEGGGQKIGWKRWWYPADPSNYSSRNPNDIDRIVIHTAEGYTGGLNTFRDPARGASAHYAIGWDGTEVLMVREEDKAWHVAVGDTNDRSIGIEHVGYAHAMQPGTPTEWSRQMLRASARLVARLARKYDIPIDREHIIAHAELDPARRSDPGPYWPWDWYIKKARWYAYRPYVFAGAGVFVVGALWYGARKREERRIRRWKKI